MGIRQRYSVRYEYGFRLNAESQNNAFLVAFPDLLRSNSIANTRQPFSRRSREAFRQREKGASRLVLQTR